MNLCHAVAFPDLLEYLSALLTLPNRERLNRLYPQKRGAALNLFTALYPLSAMVIALVDGGLLLLFHNNPRPSLLLLFAVALVALFSTSFLPPTPQSKESHFSCTKAFVSFFIIFPQTRKSKPLFLASAEHSHHRDDRLDGYHKNVDPGVFASYLWASTGFCCSFQRCDERACPLFSSARLAHR